MFDQILKMLFITQNNENYINSKLKYSNLNTFNFQNV